MGMMQLYRIFFSLCPAPKSVSGGAYTLTADPMTGYSSRASCFMQKIGYHEVSSSLFRPIFEARP
jgi:hypothetical protein